MIDDYLGIPGQIVQEYIDHLSAHTDIIHVTRATAHDLLGFYDSTEERFALLFDDLLDMGPALASACDNSYQVIERCLDVAVVTKPKLSSWAPQVNWRRLRKSEAELTILTETFDLSKQKIPFPILADYGMVSQIYPLAHPSEFAAATHLLRATKCYRISMLENGQKIAAISVLDNGKSLHAILFSRSCVRSKHSLASLAHCRAVDLFRQLDRTQIEFGVYYEYKKALDFEHCFWSGICR